VSLTHNVSNDKVKEIINNLYDGNLNYNNLQKRKIDMKKKYFIFIWILFTNCGRNKDQNNFQVSTKESANFSVQFPELQFEEAIEVKINDKIILSEIGSEHSGTSGFWNYYRYPSKITKIEFLDYYKNKLKIRKVFTDTLNDSKQRTLIVSRPFPKGRTKKNWKNYGFVSIDTGDRNVNLVDDSVQFNGMWTDHISKFKKDRDEIK